MWDVAIVGAGPVGAFAANLCGKAGLRTVVIDREAAIYELPRAVHIDHEMVRLLADVGLAEAALPLMRAGDGHLHIGADGGMIRYMSATGGARPFGYANDYFFYQPELEAILRGGLAAAGVALELGTAVEGVALEADRVRLALADGRSIDARWVLGCDGARSVVRKALGIGLDDLDFEEPWLVVDAEVDGPIRFPAFGGVPEGADLQRLSVMLCDPRRPATLVPGRGTHRRWEFMLLPGEDDAEMARPERVGELVAPYVAGTAHRILRAATYRFHGLVAETWRRGRAFLVGDSAHQTPPFFGQGMCHGMRDAANLVWKIALVERGADARLIETYQSEREAQVRHVIGAAVNVGRYICELDPQRAAERDARLRAERGIKAAAELIAPIASPIVGEGAGAGERFINPRLADGRLLDEATGGGFVLLSHEPVALDEAAAGVLDALNGTRFAFGSMDDRGLLAAWLAQRGLTAVLLRPDFYVGDVVLDGEDVSARLAAAGAAMGVEGIRAA